MAPIVTPWPAARRPRRSALGTDLLHHLPQDHGEDAAVAVVLDVRRTVEPGEHLELHRLAVLAPGDHRQRLARLQARLDALDGERLRARQAERLRALAGAELERQDAHADQVGAVDALVASG